MKIQSSPKVNNVTTILFDGVPYNIATIKTVLAAAEAAPVGAAYTIDVDALVVADPTPAPATVTKS